MIKYCVLCHKEVEIPAKPGDVKKWQRGELIQHAMPYLTPGQREMLISGVCEECFNNMFGEDDDENLCY